MKTPIHTAYVALGSNVGDRLAHLRFAIYGLGKLPMSRVDRVSPIYETAPLGPAKFGFLNAVARVRTPVAPRPMLDVLFQIERARGRQRREKWGPRTLDLDLIAWMDDDGAQVELRTDHLELPHPEAHRRDFVLRPLLDVEPTLTLGGQRLDKLLATIAPENETVEGRLEASLGDDPGDLPTKR